MPLQQGQCSNFGLCTKAETGEIITVQLGSEFRCPECNSKLKPVHGKGIPPWIKIIVAGLLLGAVAVAVWAFAALAHHHGPQALTNAQWNQLSTQVQGTLLDEPITFRQGQTQISEEEQGLIRDSLPKLENYPRSRLLVEAHVLPSESPEDDQKLSDDRASAVKNFLVTSCGIPESRIAAKGFGSSQPPERSAGESDQEWKRRSRSVRILLVGQ